MAFLLSAKGNDIKTWRAALNFSQSYRQALLECAASNNELSATEQFENVVSTLGQLRNEHEILIKQLDGLLAEIVEMPSTGGGIREITASFYDKLYHHLEIFHSAPVFYQISMAFLRNLCLSLVNQAAKQLELMPAVSLIALGPAGRFEYSPFCPLQLMIVHENVSVSESETISMFSTILHDGFEKAGLRIDPIITPRNPDWRKSLADWQQSCVHVLQRQYHDELIDILRLAEQYALLPHEEIGRQFKDISIPFLQSSRPALGNLVTRMLSLSNGLGMMGNLKVERKAPLNGLFNLPDYGLLPLSSALSALSLIKGTSASGTPQRVRELLSSNKIDVELSEKILAAWHTLHELLLLRQKSFSIDTCTMEPLYLNPDELDSGQLDSLKTALETVSVIQRQVGAIFSRMGE